MSQTGTRGQALQGVVVSDRCAKTIVVEVTRRFRHPKYGKMVARERKFHAHDESEEARVGDTVLIVECRPVSKTKCWRLVRVIARNPDQGGGLPSASETAAP